MIYAIIITAEATQVLSVVASFLTVILTGFYVVLTRMTFKEIKKQTDNQIRPYLLVVLNDGPYSDEKDIISESSSSWEGSIKGIIPTAIPSSDGLQLELKNRGKTDIFSWEIKIYMITEVGSYLSKHHLRNDYSTINIASSDYNDELIQPDDSCVVSIGRFDFLPKAQFNWEIEYTDIAGNKYTSFSGNRQYTHINKMIFDYKE